MKLFMITNRNVIGGSGRRRVEKSLGEQISRNLTFWVTEAVNPTNLSKWEKCDRRRFEKALADEAQNFPFLENLEDHEFQEHLTFFIHGYNNSWDESVERYEQICRDLFKKKKLGICVLLSLPSNGRITSYLPDRSDVRESAIQFANVFDRLFSYMKTKQRELDPKKQCRAKVSIIAHSMGCYLTQEALRVCWERHNKPLTVSLINQLVLVAGDVDNDLFASGESVDESDGDPMAQLTYRIVALFTGRDKVLGVSAGLKHFGKRRLGRSGLDSRVGIPDNVFDVDCSNLIPTDATNEHSAYFDHPKTRSLIEMILRGVDRRELVRRGLIESIHRTA